MDPVHIIVIIPVLLFAMVFHEVAHGWVALRLGDPTAQRLGRLTLNPLPHIDPFMSVILPAILLASGGIVFGGAKPVPFDPRYLKNIKRDMALIALAGPASNLLLAFGASLLLMICSQVGMDFSRSSTGGSIGLLLAYGVQINLVLAWFNMLPLPPLDGSKVLAFFMDDRIAYRYLSLERYGFLALVLLIMVGGIGVWMRPIIPVWTWLLGLAG